MACTKKNILIVDDDAHLAQMLLNILDYEGYKCVCAEDGASAFSLLKQHSFELALLDLILPDMTGLDILAYTKEKNLPMQIVLISGQGTIEDAVKATHMGAFDFLEKPLDSDRILLTVKNAIEKNRLIHIKNRLIENVREQYKMIGDSSAMREVRALITKAARSDCKVLIEGENGTGKELIARAIYFEGNRSSEPFVAVNCAAIPENLIESELFGYKKGAFTGAIEDKNGKFQTADGGTLFLDEIGDMSVSTQAKVLRVLEDNKVEMIGSNTVFHIDARIICATNRNLSEMIQDDLFRSDLYYRLNVLNIKVPPLRHRKKDIPLLVRYYIQKFCDDQGVRLKSMDGSGMNEFVKYKWPGNIRQLRNYVEKLVTITEKDLIDTALIQKTLSQNPVCNKEKLKSLQEAKKEFEKQQILTTLRDCGSNVSDAAKLLDVSRTYLYKKIRMHGIDIN